VSEDKKPESSTAAGVYSVADPCLRCCGAAAAEGGLLSSRLSLGGVVVQDVKQFSRKHGLFPQDSCSTSTQRACGPFDEVGRLIDESAW